MASQVLNFLPSEVARLVLGYLSDEGYTSSYKCFVKECPHLKEYLSLKRQGLNYPLLVNGLTLSQMLQEYAQFKLADTQRRQIMGVSALWTQLDAVVQTLKGHTACKQNQRVDGMTQGSRTRHQIQQKKRRQQIDRLQKKRDLCKRMPIIRTSVTTGRVRAEKETGREVSDTDLSEGEERAQGAGNCGVLTPPTDSETKGNRRRGAKEQEDSGRRRRETDNRETELILHSAPPSVSAPHKRSGFQRSNSISNLLNSSSQQLQNLQSKAGSRAEISARDLVMSSGIKRSDVGYSGEIQCNSMDSQILDQGGANSQDVMNVGIPESHSAECDQVGNNNDISMHEQNEPGCEQVILTMDDSTTKSVTYLETEKSNSRYSLRIAVDEQPTNTQTQTSSGPNTSDCEDDPSKHIQVLGGILSGLPVIERLQSSSQSSASSKEEVKGQGVLGQEVFPATSSEENSQESAETGPSDKTPDRLKMDFQEAQNMPETLNIPQTLNASEAPRTPVKVVDECSQMSLGRTPRRKRLPRQKKCQEKGSGNLNDSNKTEEGSLLIENITLFLNEFLNNPSLHERLAENINRTLSLRIGEKRNRKKSGRSLKTPASPRPSKPGKSEASAIAEESESNISQSLDTQHLNTFLDDILNINETQMTEAQIGGIIELTSKDPNFESLFHLFQEPHSATENQRTDFGGIGLEMGKEASINNSSLPSFTEPIDCPEPSNTTSEENLIMEILQSPQPITSHSSSHPRGLLDQTAESHESDKGANSATMEWTPCQTDNMCASTSTARNIFESIRNFTRDDSERNVTNIEPSYEGSRDKRHEVTKVSETTDDNGGYEQLPTQTAAEKNVVQVGLEQPSTSYQQLSPCPALTAISVTSTTREIGSTVIGSQSGPVLSLVNSVRPSSVPQDFKQVGSPKTNNSIVPCRSPQVTNSIPSSQEVLRASSPHPFTKLTEKVGGVASDNPKGRALMQSPVQTAIFTNQPLSPLQVSVTKSVHQSSRLSSPNCVASSLSSIRENRCDMASPAGYSGQSSKFTENTPHVNVDVQATDNITEASLSVEPHQRPKKCSEMKSPILCSHSQPRQLERESGNAKKTSQESSSQPKHAKPQKNGKSASKKRKDKEDKLSPELSKETSDADLVETFETSVTESDGFPVISIKSVMKSPQEISVEADTVTTRKTAEGENRRMSYQSFISGVTGECSTPMATREGAMKSPHTSHNSGASSEVLSEMIDLVSSMEKSMEDDSSIEKRRLTCKDDNGKRNSVKRKNVNKKKENSSSPKKLQWSPDLKALLRLVTPEKKDKNKGKKVKRVDSADKRRNPRRKVRKSNEENVKKSDAKTTPSLRSPVKNSLSKHETVAEVISKTVLEVNAKTVAEVAPKTVAKVMPKNVSGVMPKTVSEVMQKTVSDVMPKTVLETTNNGEGNQELSMPSIHTFMSPQQGKNLENDNGSATNRGLFNVVDEGGLTPRTVMTAVLALKDNSKTSSRKSLSLPTNKEQDGSELKTNNLEQDLPEMTVKSPNISNPCVLSSGATSEPNSNVQTSHVYSALISPEQNSNVQTQNDLSLPASLEPSPFVPSPNIQTSLASLETNLDVQPASSYRAEETPGIVARSEKLVTQGTDQEKKKFCVSETDYNKIMYSPNRDFLDSPPRYQSGPGVALSSGSHFYENVASTTTGQRFECSNAVVSYSSQMNIPSINVESVCDTAYQGNPVVVSDSGFIQSHPNLVYSHGISYMQGPVSDHTLNYNAVYVDDKGIPTVVPQCSDVVGLSAVSVSSTTQDDIPVQTPVTDILSAAAAVITSSPSPLKTVDSYPISSSPDAEEKEGRVGQLIAIPVGRYYPEKKLHVRSLDFGPEAGTVEIRKPGYGRGHKKKNYNISSPVKPGGLATRQSKAKGKSKGVSKSKSKTGNELEEGSKTQGIRQKVEMSKQESCPTMNKFDEDDLIPDASGSVYIVEGNTRKKIKLHKTPRITKTSSPFFLTKSVDPTRSTVPVRSVVPRKGPSKTIPAAPVALSMPVVKGNAEGEPDSDVDVDGDCELPDLSPEPARHDTPKSKCLEMVRRAEFVTPSKSSSTVNVDTGDSKYTTQPSSVYSISDSCDSDLYRTLNSSSSNAVWIDSKRSNPSSMKSIPEQPVDCLSNNSNSLPDLHSPRPFMNMSTPPKKRITASLKHGGSCYFYSSSSQEGKSQSPAESWEKDTGNEKGKVSRSPRTPKGKRTPMKGVRQSPRLLGSPNRVQRGMSTPSKTETQGSPSKNKGVKRLRETSSGEQSKPEKKSKKARNGKRTVDLSKVNFEKFLDKIHKP